MSSSKMAKIPGVESDPCSGRPATSRTPDSVECIRSETNKDQHLIVRELEANLGILKPTVSEILMEYFDMKHVMAKFVPQLLLPEQKEHRAAVANDLIQSTTNEPDFLKFITLKGTELSLCYVQCFLSCIFLSKCL